MIIIIDCPRGSHNKLTLQLIMVMVCSLINISSFLFSHLLLSSFYLVFIVTKVVIAALSVRLLPSNQLKSLGKPAHLLSAIAETTNTIGRATLAKYATQMVRNQSHLLLLARTTNAACFRR